MTESFMKGLFGGVIVESLIFPYPEPNRAEIDAIHPVLDALRKFSAKHDAAKVDREEVLHAETMDALKAIGAFGWSIPTDLGGSGFGPTMHARVMQELAGIDMSLAMVVLAHQSLAVTALLHHATMDLRARLLPRLAKGEIIGAFALAETVAGGDVAAIRTRADRDGDDYVITGDKAWVTSGTFADLFVVFARTSSADEGTRPQLSAFVVPRTSDVRSNAREPTLGVRGAGVSHVTFDRVRVPKDHVLGEIGQGLKIAMEAFPHARLSLASACIGASKRMLKLSIDRVGERKAFGRSISEFGLVRDKITRMTAAIFALESMTYLTTGIAGRGDVVLESAICKVFGSEALWLVANETQQIAAAAGYTRREPYERMLRDARAPMMFAGTNEVLRSFIALSGMHDPGRELDEVAKAMRDPIKSFGLLGHVALRKARTALGRERLSKAHPVLAHETAVFDEYAACLAKSVDKVLRRHGKNIAQAQYAQKRVCTLAIDLYAIGAVLARTTRAIERRGEEGARREIDLTALFVRERERHLATTVAAFEKNDDELRKAMAQKTCSDGGYPLDIL